MKKNIILLITLFFFVSCDPLFHDDFIIVNNCDKDISVSIVFSNSETQNFVVEYQTEYLFHNEEWVGGKSQIEKIDRLFKTITIKKGEIISNINYANHQLWKKENVESSRKNQYYTNVRYYLIVNPEDFE